MSTSISRYSTRHFGIVALAVEFAATELSAVCGHPIASSSLTDPVMLGTLALTGLDWVAARLKGVVSSLAQPAALAQTAPKTA